MKTNLKSLIILFLIAIIILISNIALNRAKQSYPLEWRVYALDLQEQGYTKEASEHIAKVEFKIIPVDKEYISLMED